MDGARVCTGCWRVVIREELRIGWFKVVRMEGKVMECEVG